MNDALNRLNSLTDEEATAELLKCCGSARWARKVAARRPFNGERDLFEAAERAWWALREEDWLEAFSAHPKIGERRAERETGEEARRWSAEEQSGAGSAATDVLDALREGNREYEEKFGHIFIICATDRSAEEMLAHLRRRLSNDDATELCVAAEEQRRITALRLRKLLNERRDEGLEAGG